MKKLPILARALAFAALPRCWSAARHATQSDIAAARSERLPPAPPDRGARRQADADRVHRRPPRRARPPRSAPRSARSRRPGGAMRPAASSSRCRTARRTSAPRWAPRAKSARSCAAPACRSIRSRCGPIAPTIRPGSAPSASTIRRCWPRPARAACGRTTSARPSIAPTYANRPYWNHGCANQRNLAAQVDNPADLVQPRAETPVLTSRRATALDKYRKGEPTATQYPDANKGKISDVGQ